MAPDGEINAAKWLRYVIMKSLDEKAVRIFDNEDFDVMKELPFQSEYEMIYNAMWVIKSVAEIKDFLPKTPKN